VSRGAARLACAVALAALLVLPLFLGSYAVTLFIFIFFYAYLGQAWNIVGGYAGQLSAGHAAFVGVGAYASAMLSMHAGLTPWIGMFIGGALSACLGVVIGYLGFRFGLPTHADLVLDVRFLPNPFFIPELKPHPGTDPRVASFVLDQPDAKAFLERITDLLGFLLPRYRAEGKTYLTIAIGCTGGKHRSVAIAGALAERLEGGGQPVRLWHRDVEKE